MKNSLFQNAVVAMVAASGTFFAVQAPPETTVERSWPPDPATEIVNLQGVETFKKRSRDRVIYTIPEEQYFVMTGFRREEVTANDPDLDLVMRLANKKEITVFDNRMGKSYSAAAGIGITFPPKSRIVLHRTNELSGDLVSLYFVTGYLVPAPEEKGKR